MQSVPKIHLLLMNEADSKAFDETAKRLELHPSVDVTWHDCALSMLSEEDIQFDAVVSPANSYGIMDGGFDDALSRTFGPRDDYGALTRLAREALFKEWRGFAPPGTCTIARIPNEFKAKSKNTWGTKHLLLCPTMRLPQRVNWDREIVYECVWSMLCAVDKHNQSGTDEPIKSLLMTPLATTTGGVSADKWAAQLVLAINHFIAAEFDDKSDGPHRWSNPDEYSRHVQYTWPL